MDKSALAFVIITGAVLILGATAVIQTVSNKHMQDYSLFYETVENDTDLTSEAYHLLDTNRASDKKTANLTTSYNADKCTSTSNITINGHYIGNLSGASPKTFYNIPGSYIDVPSEVDYHLEPNCPVNHSKLVYYRYANCSADEATCDMWDTSENTVSAILLPLPYLLLALFVILLVSVGSWLIASSN